MVLRKRSDEDIERAIKQRFSKSRRKNMYALVNYWVDTLKSATNLKKSGGKRSVSEIIKSRRSNVTSLHRITIGFSFYNESNEDEQNIGIDIDVSVGYNKKELYVELVKKITDWLIQYYGLKTATAFYRSNYAKLIDIKAIEGI